METALVSSLRESSGYLEDEGWKQTAQLMTLAAHEIQRLNAQVRELEAHLDTLSEDPDFRAPAASNQNSEPLAPILLRR